MDDLVYMNSPVHYLPNLPADHPYMELYRHRKAIICVGQGPWEEPVSTYQLRIFFSRNKFRHGWTSGDMTVRMTGTGGISR